MLLSNCGICHKKKTSFIKNKELHNFNDSFETHKMINKNLVDWRTFQAGIVFKIAGSYL